MRRFIELIMVTQVARPDSEITFKVTALDNDYDMELVIINAVTGEEEQVFRYVAHSISGFNTVLDDLHATACNEYNPKPTKKKIVNLAQYATISIPVVVIVNLLALVGIVGILPSS